MIDAKNDKVQKILKWRETLSTMPDERFFEIMRIYIGEIHTPFNKDKLIEQLSSIFRKEQNQQKIIAYLSDFDLKMLSTLKAISNATQEKLITFFKEEYSLSDIYSEIINLNERLLIFTYFDTDSNQNIIQINPLLEQVLDPYLYIDRLFIQEECCFRNMNPVFHLTPLFLGAFISYIQENPELCKNDLSIKKKNLEELEEIFPGKIDCLILILNAFLNLGILKAGEKSLNFDEKRLSNFVLLSEFKQYAYLATASQARLGRDLLRKQTQLLIDVCATIPDTGFTKASLIRSSFLILNKSQNNEPVRQSRFSKILADYNSSQSSKDTDISNLFPNIINAAIEFGLFSLYGKTESGKKIFTKGDVSENEEFLQQNKKGLLNINAGSFITLMPGLTLEELLPLVAFLKVQKCSTVTEFEINRKSVSRAYDKSISPEQIFNLLEEYSAYEIPQNLKININDWHSTYSSAVLYKGYVLKVDEKSARIIEKNPNIAPFIQLQMAPGVYLLNIQPDQDILEFQKNSGLEFMGTVKTPKYESEASEFPMLLKGTNLLSEKNNNQESNEIENIKLAEEIKKSLIEKLEELSLTAQQKECLLSRINRKVILTPEQLNPNSVRLEILEVEGMNYSGKLRLVENAIQNNDLIEITISDDDNNSVIKTILCRPLMLSKHTNDSLVRVQHEENGEIRFYSVSKANKIKIIKTSLFRH